MISQCWLSLVNISTIVDVEEERRYTSKQRHFQHYGIYQDKRNECGEEGTFIVFSGFGHKIGITISSSEYRYWISQSSEGVTKRIFQMFSRFGHKTRIRQSSKGVSTMSIDLQQNASHNFLGVILCFNSYDDGGDYSLKNITSGFIWSDYLYRLDDDDTEIVLVPGSIFLVSEGDERIELTSSAKNIIGIDLLYKDYNDRRV
ncbi:hypothetical protein POM88_019886 [Heracleum sosnowskyi]|uniref:Uncharacterized protein n=1 Tax=Heracleum sosnowskyi TaxID=360622 RepID=A0AAD8IBS6_9APIA|nr:hypothetical protein POM88_019886 [Heracleum sosnowskyi]